MIREHRLKLKMTQEQLAEKTEISWRQLQRIEADEEHTRLSTIKRLIKVLDIPDEEILAFIKK